MYIFSVESWVSFFLDTLMEKPAVRFLAMLTDRLKGHWVITDHYEFKFLEKDISVGIDDKLEDIFVAKKDDLDQNKDFKF